MIQKYVDNLAGQMGISLTRISIVDGRSVGCLGVHLLHLGTNDKLVSALVHKSDLDDLSNDICSDRLELRIRVALSRLEINENAVNSFSSSRTTTDISL